jgi:hypothetical protein
MRDYRSYTAARKRRSAVLRWRMKDGLHTRDAGAQEIA